MELLKENCQNEGFEKCILFSKVNLAITLFLSVY
jgi:hypothetical protein